ncbi:MAG: heparan-alpha-glucosaminide N-acetyltransferase domain-containing protein [Cytophagaceae bacterium]
MPQTSSQRIDTLDILRGLVMLLMLLDHTRDFFHRDAFAFSPTDPDYTTIGLFTTRWITHICAPAFVWLAGYSIAIQSTKKSPTDLAVYLLTRGLFLILLEFTIVKFAWHFEYNYNQFGLLVIWALGVSMISLIPLLFLPRLLVFVLGFILLISTGFLQPNSFDNLFWHILFSPGKYILNDHLTLNILYPVLPMIGLLWLGYGMYDLTVQWFYQKICQCWGILGLVLLAFFGVIRYVNTWGDWHPWKTYPTIEKTIFSFLNITKYPMSLCYLLATMGIVFMLLGALDYLPKRFKNILSTYGRVPLFFYLLHLYLVHSFSLIVGQLIEFSYPERIAEEGRVLFDLPLVYIVSILCGLLIYPLCKIYSQIKKVHVNFLTRHI